MKSIASGLFFWRFHTNNPAAETHNLKPDSENPSRKPETLNSRDRHRNTYAVKEPSGWEQTSLLCVRASGLERKPNEIQFRRGVLDNCRGFYYWTGLNYNQEHVYKLADTSLSVLLWFSRRFACWFLASKVVGEGDPEDWKDCTVWARVQAKHQFYENSGYIVPDTIHVPWDKDRPSQVFLLKSLDGFFYGTVNAHQQKNEKMRENIREAVKMLEARDEEIKGLKRQLAELQMLKQAEKKPKAQPQQPPAYRRVAWEGQQATAKPMGPRAFADDGSVKEPAAEPVTEAKEEPQQEPPAEPKSPPNKMGRASCWSESHGDVSGYLKSGLLGSQQFRTICSPKFLKLT